jgi:hypothetical protein
VIAATTFVVGLGVAGFVGLFGLRRTPPPIVEVRLDDVTATGSGVSLVPTVTLRVGHVLLDGVEIGGTDVAASGNRVQRIDTLLDALKRHRLTRGANGMRVVFDVAADVPAVFVKSAFQTASLAGYPDVSFVVSDAGAP